METIEDIRSLPEIDADAIHIWGLHVPDHLSRMDEMMAVLDTGEREKALRYHKAADRYSSIAARSALRILLAGYTGRPFSDIRFEYTENGKPHVEGSAMEFNVSHSGDWIVLAFGFERAIGVDIEQIRREVDVEAIAARYFTAEEKAEMEESEDSLSVFYRLWALKEAYVKACGSTLFAELGRMSVPIEDGAERAGWFFYHLESGPEYASAVVTDKSLVRMPCYDFGGLKWGN